MARPTPISLYTDGTQSPHKGVGGWAAVIEEGRNVRTVRGAEEKGQSRDMEVRAIVEGLNALPEGSHVTVYTDVVQLAEKLKEFAAKAHSAKTQKPDTRFPMLDDAVRRHARVEAIANIRKNPRGYVKGAITGILPLKQQAHEECTTAADELWRKLSATSSNDRCV